jgi:acyl-CoA dehydrogenase
LVTRIEINAMRLAVLQAAKAINARNSTFVRVYLSPAKSNVPEKLREIVSAAIRESRS